MAALSRRHSFQPVLALVLGLADVGLGIEGARGPDQSADAAKLSGAAGQGDDPRKRGLPRAIGAAH